MIRFTESIECDSRLSPILHNLGSIYEALGAFEAALMAYNNAA